MLKNSSTNDELIRKFVIFDDELELVSVLGANRRGAASAGPRVREDRRGVLEVGPDVAPMDTNE